MHTRVRVDHVLDAPAEAIFHLLSDYREYAGELDRLEQHAQAHPSLASAVRI